MNEKKRGPRETDVRGGVILGMVRLTCAGGVLLVQGGGELLADILPWHGQLPGLSTRELKDEVMGERGRLRGVTRRRKKKNRKRGIQTLMMH